MKGLSRMRGNSHVRFLGEGLAVMSSSYPILRCGAAGDMRDVGAGPRSGLTSAPFGRLLLIIRRSRARNCIRQEKTPKFFRRGFGAQTKAAAHTRAAAFQEKKKKKTELRTYSRGDTGRCAGTPPTRRCSRRGRRCAQNTWRSSADPARIRPRRCSGRSWR